MDSQHLLTLAQQSGCTAQGCELIAPVQTLTRPLLTPDKQVLRAFPDTARALDDLQAARGLSAARNYDLPPIVYQGVKRAFHSRQGLFERTANVASRPRMDPFTFGSRADETQNPGLGPVV